MSNDHGKLIFHNHHFFRMSFCDTVDLDAFSDSSSLSSANTGDTPTIFSDESPSIQALLKAQNERAYHNALDKIPSDHKVKIADVYYVKYDHYRSKKSRRDEWYWKPEQAEELIRITKGSSPFPFI